MSEHRSERYFRENRQSNLSSYLNMKKKIGTVNRMNEKARKLGENHYNVGHSLEEADDELRNDDSFIMGYNNAKRADEATDYMYDKGIEYFEKGIEVDKFPPIYANNPNFLRGYNEALRASMKSNNRHR